MAWDTLALMPSLISVGNSPASLWVEGVEWKKQWLINTPPTKRLEMTSSLADLGEDLLLKILQMARPSAEDLCRFAGVNRMWKQLCYAPEFWQRLSIGHGNMHEGLEHVAGRCVGLRELHIEDPLCELHILHPIIVACGSALRKVSLDCDKDTTSRNEASICSILWIISLYCKHVETIELLSGGQEATLSCLENKAMWYLTSGFRRVRHFTCLCNSSITKQSVYLIVIAWRDLASLRIHCGALQMEDLMALRKCYTLRHLELVGGKSGLVVAPALGSVMHAELESITFSESCCSSRDILALASLCPKLTRVVVHFWACRGESALQCQARREGLQALRGRMGTRSIDLQLVD